MNDVDGRLGTVVVVVVVVVVAVAVATDALLGLNPSCVVRRLVSRLCSIFPSCSCCDINVGGGGGDCPDGIAIHPIIVPMWR